MIAEVLSALNIVWISGLGEESGYFNSFFYSQISSFIRERV